MDPQHPSSTEPAPASTRPLPAVLVVDDNPINCRLLTAQLQAEGHRVLTAADGLQALAILERGGVDAIISDILMPNMDGYRLCYEIRRSTQWRHLPFIFHSATYTSPGDAALARQVGGDEFLIKPAATADLLDALRKHWPGKRAQAALPSSLDQDLETMQQYSQRLVAKLEEKNAELEERSEALRQSEARLRDLFDNAHDLIVIISPDGRLLYFNPAWQRTLGYSQAELQQVTIFDLVHPDCFDHCQTAFHQVSKEGQSLFVDATLIGKGGHRITVEGNCNPSLHEGKLVSVRAIFRDVTERKQAEALVKGQNLVLEKIAIGAPLQETLDELLRFIEALSPDMICSILLLEPDGVHVRHGAGPSLPEAFKRAIDGEAIGPSAGSCGTAAYRREPVYVGDIATDPLWTNYREGALACGLRACWSTPIFDDQRRVVGTFAIYYRQPGLPKPEHRRLIDVATSMASIAVARELRERELRDREARFRGVFESPMVGTLFWDASGQITGANEAFLDLLGYSKEELAGGKLNWVALTPPEYREADRRALLELTATGRCTPFEKEYIRKDGRRVPIILGGATLKGLPDGGVAFVLDITERKRAEQERRDIFERVSDAFVALDKNWRYTYVNDKAAQLFGRQPQDLIGKNIWTEFPEGVGQPFHLAYERAMREQVYVQIEEYYPPYDRWFENRIYPSPEGLSIFFTDITARKLAENQLRVAGEQLRALVARIHRAQEEERTRVSREIHDELGQLLTGLKMDLRWLERKLSESEPFSIAINPLLERVLAASELTDTSIATVQKIAAELRPGALDKLGLAAALQQEGRRFEERTGIRCTVVAPEKTPSLTKTAVTELFYICREALTNVARHAHASQVMIRLELRSNHWRVEIADDGLGLPEERLHEARSLGLIGMRERASLCAGTVQFERNQPCGTSVVVMVPMAANQENCETESPV
jgi:PAS domain S-box-containing protein